MGFGYKRSDLRKIAESKLRDAIILVRAGRFSNGYYLAGYTVEIGLKACIAARVVAETMPDKEISAGFFDHQYRRLVRLAGLEDELRKAVDADSDFAANWAIASEWSPESRYEFKDVVSAQAMITAVADPKSGVLRWIRKYW